jgi:purine-binding chemotaxis protein CheW
MVKRGTVKPPARVEEPPPEEQTYEYLGFVLADESYALPLTSIREILKVPPVTQVPRAPHDVLGIVSVRGRVTTVIDLRRRLRMPESPMTKSTRVLLVDEGSEILGVLVDGVLSVVRLSEEEVELAANVGSDTADYVLGIGRPQVRASRGEDAELSGQRDEILILLDPQPLLRR